MKRTPDPFRAGKDGKVRLVVDPNSMGSIRVALADIERMRTRLLLQVGADYGQIRALRGETSSAKRAELEPFIDADWEQSTPGPQSRKKGEAG